jgi:hypothetical protein
MITHLRLGGVVLCAGLCVGALAVWSRAGDLVPPEGPIGSTMVTLQDVKTSLDAIGQALNVPTPTWHATATIVAENEEVIVLSGTGVIHDFTVTSFDLVPTGALLIVDGIEVIWVNADERDTSSVTLNIRYNSEVRVRGQRASVASTAVRYRPDGPSPQ